MTPNSPIHWWTMIRRISRDSVILFASFVLAIWLRLGDFDAFWPYFPALVALLVVFPVTAYILGLYSNESQGTLRFSAHVLLLLGALLMGALVMALVGYVDFSTRVGRGVLAIGSGIALPVLLLHHWLMVHRHRIVPVRLAFVAESPEEIAEFEHIRSLCPPRVEFVGRIVIARKYRQEPDILGHLGEVDGIISRHRLDRIVFPGPRLQQEETRPILSRLRYSGTRCLPVISLCEEYLQCVPVELVTPEWLLHSCETPQVFYLRKVKRAFDLIVAVSLLVLLFPFLLAGVILVKAVSPGPAIFRQRRSGRFGRPFEIFKLRTMRLDAEKNGPQWAAGDRDPRIIPGGAWLRKYRIDEIPQLLNIIRGEMSFVGPRPEQPGFVESLSKEIPFYQERLMVQPGLTGWAQVSYPYGASVDDAICKLEYDLYYMKHMGLVFDLLILLDTVRVVLLGGLKQKHVRPRFELQKAITQRMQIPVDTSVA